MSEEFITYRSFPSRDEARKVAASLEKEGIGTEIGNSQKTLDPVLAGTAYDDNIVLRIKLADFKKANEILIKSGSIAYNDIDPAHPLFELSVDELKDILARPEEWGADNYNIALALLANRGANIQPAEIELKQEEHMHQLAERKSINFSLIGIGYASGLVNIVLIFTSYQFDMVKNRGVWFLPGLYGIIIGGLILGAKTILPDGRTIPTYNNQVRWHAIAMFSLNVLAWLINAVAMMFW